MGFWVACLPINDVPPNCSWLGTFLTTIFPALVFALVYGTMRYYCERNDLRRRCRRRYHDELDSSSIVKTLPIFVHSTSAVGGENEIDCAVCLAEFEDGERCRLLPNCKHVFHVECIDAWFKSSYTCPLCRRHVRADVTLSPEVVITVREEPIITGSARFPMEECGRMPFHPSATN